MGRVEEAPHLVHRPGDGHRGGRHGARAVQMSAAVRPPELDDLVLFWTYFASGPKLELTHLRKGSVHS